ncbi:MAG TPA: hypothetical protein VK497_02080 [Candidatus Saccharimonadales bacterium]|nr:hypothetical protein [Candidatus Saccharimonadales bacterium]
MSTKPVSVWAGFGPPKNSAASLKHVLRPEASGSASYHQEACVHVQRRLSDRQYVPGEVGQMDIKHWKKTV